MWQEVCCFETSPPVRSLFIGLLWAGIEKMATLF